MTLKAKFITLSDFSVHVVVIYMAPILMGEIKGSLLLLAFFFFFTGNGKILILSRLKS